MSRALSKRHLILWLATAALCAAQPAAQQTIPLTQGMVIDRSVTIRPGSYRLSGSADLKTPAIRIRGENITVDFNGARLVGSADDADPDEFAGVAILVEGGRNITIRGATIRGFKVGILALNSPDLHITGNDLSHNWKQRLYSGIEKESLVDWMSYHQNEKDEWLRFGAAIYLSRCDRGEIDHNTILQGQNGVMATASQGLKIWNNTIQFMSSIGVGLYRVSDSTIMHNRIDWCVRGYSHGFYNRGQDSAGLLMYEQSSRNTVAYNSITHGGDGLFLWAGQSTMDTGKGGANGNLFYKNDFSHAPTNGIEATFSHNLFLNNRVEDCWHGVWGGYSFNSVWASNTFKDNAEGIAIEHGQGNRIHENVFDGHETAIRLWSNESQDPNWGYPKHRDTASRDHSIYANTFTGHTTAIRIDRTERVLIANNRFDGVRTRLEASPSARDIGPKVKPKLENAMHVRVLPLPLDGGTDALIPMGKRRGRETIIVDDWGPFDWKSPKLWPVLPSDGKLPFQRRAKATGVFDGPVRLNVLGPDGAWKLGSVRGATITPTEGKVGDVISVTPESGSVTDYEIVLSYTGSEVTSPRGVVTAAGTPYTFSYSRFFAPADWTIRFFEYPETLVPMKDTAAFAKLVSGKPVKTSKADRIDFLSGGVLEEGVARDRFAFAAEGTVTLPRGDYTLQLISDDGARVWVDGKLVLDAWEPHESRVDEAATSGGTRKLKVEYYEVSGWAEIRLDIQPRRTRN